MKIKGAIFDLDGTLFDSMGIWMNLGSEYFKIKGLEYSFESEKILSAISLEKAAEYLIQNFGVADSKDEIVNDFVEIVKPFYFNEVKLKPGVKEFLEILSRDGVPMCIATASDRIVTEAGLKRNGIDGYFKKIFTCSEVGSGKDKPDIFNAALKCLGTEKENTWVFEDSCHAAETAKKAGFNVCGVYDVYADSKIKNVCDLYINSFADIKK